MYLSTTLLLSQTTTTCSLKCHAALTNAALTNAALTYAALTYVKTGVYYKYINEFKLSTTPASKTTSLWDRMSESCVPWFWMVSMGLVYSVMVYSGAGVVPPK